MSKIQKSLDIANSSIQLANSLANMGGSRDEFVKEAARRAFDYYKDCGARAGICIKLDQARFSDNIESHTLFKHYVDKGGARFVILSVEAGCAVENTGDGGFNNWCVSGYTNRYGNSIEIV